MNSMSSHGPVQALEVSVALWAAGRESGADGLNGGSPFRCENCLMKLSYWWILVSGDLEK